MTPNNRSLFPVVMLTLVVCANALAVDLEDAVEARQSFMTIYQYNIDLLSDMDRGDIPYSGKHVRTAANNLLALARMNNSAMWPAGSGEDNPLLSEKTSARAEIWSDYSELSYRHGALISALERFAYYAPRDKNSLKLGLKSVKGACQDCHRRFRTDKD